MSLFDTTTFMSNLTTAGVNERLVQQYIPSYVSKDAWQPWDAESGEPCPAGFTCAMMGNSSLGAFSCDESECALWALIEINSDK